jgi:hypothetical protein
MSPGSGPMDRAGNETREEREGMGGRPGPRLPSWQRGNPAPARLGAHRVATGAPRRKGLPAPTRPAVMPPAPGPIHRPSRASGHARGRSWPPRAKRPRRREWHPPGPTNRGCPSLSAPGDGNVRIPRMIPGKTAVPAGRLPMNFLLQLRRIGSRTAPMGYTRPHRGGAFHARIGPPRCRRLEARGAAGGSEGRATGR